MQKVPEIIIHLSDSELEHLLTALAAQQPSQSVEQFANQLVQQIFNQLETDLNGQSQGQHT